MKDDRRPIAALAASMRRARTRAAVAGLALHGAGPPVRRRVRADPARPARRHVADRPLAARRRQVHRLRQLLADLERLRLLARARVHRQIHARADADPDGPRLCARAAHGREHAAQAADPHHRFPAGGDRALEFEPAVVLAARRTGRALQQAARRPAPDHASRSSGSPAPISRSGRS